MKTGFPAQCVLRLRSLRWLERAKERAAKRLRLAEKKFAGNEKAIEAENNQKCVITKNADTLVAARTGRPFRCALPKKQQRKLGVI
jgi:hypothetical protein